ncbi:MAG TPA: ankyrin repeat domain-containing protein [Gammaproteobacteria bacterium]|jgi:ankyrin repeat protein|nr:ankyrin repeat domain-containing protein [Gammaproteobacteria bacterium]
MFRNDLSAIYGNGNTPLIIAVILNQENNVRDLLVTDVNATNKDNNTALIMAAAYGRTTIAQLLLTASNINVNAANVDGYTALSKAAQCGHQDIVELLLNFKGIDLTIRNYSHYTAADEARIRGLKDIADLIDLAAEQQRALIAKAEDDQQFFFDTAVDCRIC